MRTLRALLRSTTPAAPLEFVRVIIGVALAVDGLATWGTLSRLFQPGILAVPILPVPRLSPEWVTTYMVVWLGSAVAFAMGWPRRLSGVTLVGVLAYMLVLDQQTYSNHLYLLALVVGLITIGQWQSRGPVVPMWPVFLLKAQLTIVYTFAAVSKMNPAFMSGAMIYANLRRPLLETAPALVSFPVLVTVAVASIATELFLGWALWSVRWRRTAAMVGVIFHTSLVLVMDDPTTVGLAVFAATCVSLYVLFFDSARQAGSPLMVRVESAAH